jgi:hypothetical protein
VAVTRKPWLWFGIWKTTSSVIWLRWTENLPWRQSVAWMKVWRILFSHWTIGTTSQRGDLRWWPKRNKEIWCSLFWILMTGIRDIVVSKDPKMGILAGFTVYFHFFIWLLLSSFLITICLLPFRLNSLFFFSLEICLQTKRVRFGLKMISYKNNFMHCPREMIWFHLRDHNFWRCLYFVVGFFSQIMSR